MPPTPASSTGLRLAKYLRYSLASFSHCSSCPVNVNVTARLSFPAPLPFSLLLLSHQLLKLWIFLPLLYLFNMSTSSGPLLLPPPHLLVELSHLLRPDAVAQGVQGLLLVQTHQNLQLSQEGRGANLDPLTRFIISIPPSECSQSRSSPWRMQVSDKTRGRKRRRVR